MQSQTLIRIKSRNGKGKRSLSWICMGNTCGDGWVSQPYPQARTHPDPVLIPGLSIWWIWGWDNALSAVYRYVCVWVFLLRCFRAKYGHVSIPDCGIFYHKRECKLQSSSAGNYNFRMGRVCIYFAKIMFLQSLFTQCMMCTRN